MANCASVGIPPSEAGRLSLAEYSGLIFQTNLRNETGEEPVEAPSDDWFDREIAECIEMGIGTLH